MVDNVDPRPDVKEGHMKQYASKVFCPAPFLHGYLNVTNSGFKLCCMSSIVDRLDVGKLNEKNISTQRIEAC